MALKTADHKGTTLVETMAAVLLFSLVMGSLLDVSLQSISMGKRSQYAYTAFNLAKNHIEKLRSMPFSSLVNAGEIDKYLDSTGTPNAEGPFIRQTTVTPGYTNDQNLVRIQVSVNYLWKGTPSADTTQLTSVIFMYT